MLMNSMLLEINIIRRICVAAIISSFIIVIFASEFNHYLISSLFGVLLGSIKLWITGKVYKNILKSKSDEKVKSILTVNSIHILFFILLTVVILISSTIWSKNIVVGFCFGVLFVYLMVFVYTIELIFKKNI